MSGESLALRLTGLKKTFRSGMAQREVEAVRGIDLEVSAGQIFGFLGPNGAGKTTTMKMIMGLIGPTEGSIEILERPLSDSDVRQRIGYLPEHPSFYTYLTAEEILDFCGRLFGLSGDVRRQRSRDLIELVGLGHAADRRLRGYSKGMLQRVGVAQALMNDPDLVIFDEPLSGLDPIGRREVREIICGLRDRGKTVFFSSHILHDIETICDQVAIVQKGRIAAQGSLSELLETGERRVAILFTGEAAQIPGALTDRAREVALGWEMEASADEREGILRQLLDANMAVTHVQPVRASLEELFVEEAGAP